MKRTVIIVFFLFLICFILLIEKKIMFENEWSYLKCLENCNNGVNVPYKFCNYEMVQKLIDHGKCFWDMKLVKI